VWFVGCQRSSCQLQPLVRATSGQADAVKSARFGWSVRVGELILAGGNVCQVTEVRPIAQSQPDVCAPPDGERRARGVGETESERAVSEFGGGGQSDRGRGRRRVGNLRQCHGNGGTDVLFPVRDNFSRATP
jgi:hypothetical protein